MVVQSEDGVEAESQSPGRPEVNLPDADPRAFELVLSYIYTDRIHPTKKGRGKT